MRRKLLFLMLFAGLLCLPVTARAEEDGNLNKNPSFEIDEVAGDYGPDGWWYWTWTGGGGSYDDIEFTEDPAGARTGNWYFQGLGSGWGSSATPTSTSEWMTPIKQGGTYYVGGYAKDLKPGDADSPTYPDSEVIYWSGDDVRVGDTEGDPYRHGLFLSVGDPGTPTYPEFLNTPFPRDGEYHLFYGFTQHPDLLPDEAAYITAGCWLHPGSEYAFDDMYTGIALPGSLVWPVDPYDDEAGVSPNQHTLQWARQQVCDGDRAIKCEVWWGSDDPNFWTEDPIKIMELTDTNSLDLWTIPAPLGGPIVLAPEEHYYWAIKYEEPNECFWGNPDLRASASDGWYFNTINDPPVVDAGLHQDVWQDPCSNPIVIGIDASYSDDGNPEGGVVSHSWNTVGGVVYFPHQLCQDPNVTIAAPGDYELTLTVHDGVGDVQDKTGQDTILIRVFANDDDRLRAHYPLDTNATDSVGGHNGTLEDDPVFNPNGQVAGAIELDGTDDVGPDGFGDYVSIDDTGSDPNFQPDTWENSDLIDGMTVSAWMKLDEDGWSKDWETVVAKSTDSWEMLRSGTTNNVGFAVKGGIGSAGSGDNNPVNDNKWHQVVGVYDRNTVKFYVDGIEAGSSDAGTLDLEAESNFDKDGQPINTKIWQVPKSAGKILVGNTNNPSINPNYDTSFGGLIDQVRIFDAAVPWWAQYSNTPGIVEMYRGDGGHISCGGQYVASDVNEDCFVTLVDFALLALDWVECTNVADEDCDLAHHEEE